jgi:hypothetical protein
MSTPSSHSRTFSIVATLLFFAVTLLLPATIKAQSDDDIKVKVGVMAPQIVSDTFGRRVAQNFVAVQVTVANHNTNYQYLINDVTLSLDKVFIPHVPSEDGLYISSAELSLLRGVAEKGQGQDTRNKTLRLFRGVGTIAAGLIGVTSFGPSYAKSVAVFNGPVISAFSEAFPDYTINQMNRLSDSAYQANTLVPAKHSKVMVAFIPQAMFLNETQRKQFWKDPTGLYPDTNGGCSSPLCVDFRKADIYLDGNFITEVSTLPPAVSTAVFSSTEMQKFQNDKPVVSGSIVGRFLSGASISLLNQQPKGLSIAADGEPTPTRLNFIVKSDRPVPPGTRLNFEVSNAQGVQNFSKDLLYLPDPPTLTAISPNTGKQNSSVTVTLTGTNFVPEPGNTVVRISGSGVEVSDPVEVLGSSMKVTFKISATAAVGTRNVTVINPNSESKPVTFTITAGGANP